MNPAVTSDGMKAATLTLAILLAGCAASVKMSTPRAAVVAGQSLSSAQRLAQAECQKRAWRACFRALDGDQYAFDCVD